MRLLPPPSLAQWGSTRAPNAYSLSIVFQFTPIGWPIPTRVAGIVGEIFLWCKSARDQKHLLPTNCRCDEHLLSVAELAKKHNTSLNVDAPNQSKGITTAEAEKRLKEFGLNQMSPPKGIPDWLKFLLKVRQSLPL